MGKPQYKEPDIVCNKNTLIEIVDIYDNQYQAEKLWSNYRKFKQKNSLSLNTYDNLEKEVRKKYEKLNNGNYNGAGSNKRIILLCAIMNPHITDNDVKEIRDRYIPLSKDSYFSRYFDEVWILWKSGIIGKYRITPLEQNLSVNTH